MTRSSLHERALQDRTPSTSAGSVALLEPPGFLMLNYGLGTPLVSVVAHVTYGTVVGGFIGLAS